MKQSRGLSPPTMLTVIEEAVGLTRHGAVRRRRELRTSFPLVMNAPGKSVVPAPATATCLVDRNLLFVDRNLLFETNYMPGV